MLRRQGMVLELTGEQAFVLTRDGEFRRIPRTADMQVGLTVAFDDVALTQMHGQAAGAHGAVASAQVSGNHVRPSNRRGLRRRMHRPWVQAGGAIAAALVIAAGVWTYTGITHPVTAEAYAWVSVDVNPSVSLKVSPQLKVTQALGTDADGQKLVAAIQLTGLTLSAATAKIMDYATTNHLVTSDATVLVSVSPIEKSADTTKVKSSAEAGIARASHHNPSAAKVYTVDVPSTIWSEATKAKVSPGRLMSALVAAEEGHPTSVSAAEGQVLNQVWSDPKEKTALSKLEKNDAKAIHAVVNALKTQGLLGSGQDSGDKGPNPPDLGNGKGKGKAKGSGQKHDQTTGKSGHGDSSKHQPPGDKQGGAQNAGDGGDLGNTLRGAINTLAGQGNAAGHGGQGQNHGQEQGQGRGQDHGSSGRSPGSDKKPSGSAWNATGNSAGTQRGHKGDTDSKGKGLGSLLSNWLDGITGHHGHGGERTGGPNGSPGGNASSPDQRNGSDLKPGRDQGSSPLQGQEKDKSDQKK